MKRAGRLAAAALTGSMAGGVLVAAVPPALAASAPGIITTVAGGPGRGIATHVAQEPLSLLAGPGGAVYLGDNGVVRELSSTSSSEKVLAGVGPTSPPRFNGGHLATRTAVGDISGMALDAAGNLVIPGMFNQLEVVAGATGMFYGQAMTAGYIYSFRTDRGAGSTAPVLPGGWPSTVPVTCCPPKITPIRCMYSRTVPAPFTARR